MFLQVVQGRVGSAADVRDAFERWVRELAPGTSGWLGSTAGVTEDGVFVGVTRFTSEETARRSAARLEQREWWTQTGELFADEPVVHECRQVELMGAGGSDRAGFVQVIQGRTDAPDRLTALSRAFEPQMAVHRPDLLGMTLAFHGDGGFTEVAYFSSEAEAREGERREAPPELAPLLEEETSLMSGLSYLDLREPWLHSPPEST